MSAASRKLISEWPPSAKKSESRVTAGTSRSRAQIAASLASVPARGDSPGTSTVRSSFGEETSPAARAARSTLPFAVSGSAANPRHRRRHHVRGHTLGEPLERILGHRAIAGHEGHEALVPGLARPGPAPLPAATPGCSTSAASISPGSIRKPRIFTCSSARPRNSSAPSARQRTRSPVRYSRAPGLAERVGHEPLGGQLRPAEVAARQAVAADVQLARHAHRDRAAVARPARRPWCSRSAGRSGSGR